jgi:beta-phosphoglucomutase-like phosphatase (HAD superfamily)
MIRAIVFDFDGLIFDTETPMVDAYGEIHRKRNMPFDLQDSRVPSAPSIETSILGRLSVRLRLAPNLKPKGSVSTRSSSISKKCFPACLI